MRAEIPKKAFWKIYRVTAIPLAVLLIIVAIAVPVYAQLYSMPVAFTETAGTDHGPIALLVEVPVSWMITQGYVTRSGARDVWVEDLSGTVQKYMVAEDRIGVFISDLTADTQINRLVTTGNTPYPYFNIVLGYNSSVAVADAANLELGSVFSWEIRGFVDTRAGTNKDLVYKEDAFRIYVPAAGEIRAAMLSAGDVEELAVNATGISSNLYTLEVTATATDFWITVDGAVLGTAAQSHNVTDNANNWTLARNNSMPYIEYIKLET